MLSITLCRLLLRSALETNQQFISKIIKRWFESGKRCFNPESFLSQTHTLVQEGQKIQELPMIVQRIVNIGAFCEDKVQKSNNKSKVNIQKIRSYHFYV